MPAPITHIVFAEKILKELWTDKNRQDFLIGTSLPDFRYVGNLDRQITHLQGLKFEEIEKEKSFRSGFLFHSLLDEFWVDFYLKQPDYPFVLEPKHLTGMSIKFLEDEIYYQWLGGWPEIAGFFGKVLPEELAISDSSYFEEINVWYGALSDYFSQAPNEESRRKFLRFSEINDDLAADLNRFIANLRRNQRALEMIGEFYDYFRRRLGLG